MAEAPLEAKPEMNLRQKLVQVMMEVGSVEKAGRNKDQGYAFQRAADIFEKTQAAFIRQGIAFLSDEESVEWPDTHETKNGATVFVCRVKMNFMLLDTVTDEKIMGRHSGIGFDTSDKALNKAKTAALKYFLKDTLLIGEDEDDGDNDNVEAAAPACPVCGMVTSFYKSRKEGEGYFCWKKKGGCGATFTEEAYAERTRKAEPQIDRSTSQEVPSEGTEPPAKPRGRPKRQQEPEPPQSVAPSEPTGLFEKEAESVGAAPERPAIKSDDGDTITAEEAAWTLETAKKTGAALGMMIGQYAPNLKGIKELEQAVPQLTREQYANIKRVLDTRVRLRGAA